MRFRRAGKSKSPCAKLTPAVSVLGSLAAFTHSTAPPTAPTTPTEAIPSQYLNNIYHRPLEHLRPVSPTRPDTYRLRLDAEAREPTTGPPAWKHTPRDASAPNGTGWTWRTEGQHVFGDSSALKYGTDAEGRVYLLPEDAASFAAGPRWVPPVLDLKKYERSIVEQNAPEYTSAASFLGVNPYYVESEAVAKSAWYARFPQRTAPFDYAKATAELMGEGWVLHSGSGTEEPVGTEETVKESEEEEMPAPPTEDDLPRYWAVRNDGTLSRAQYDILTSYNLTKLAAQSEIPDTYTEAQKAKFKEHTASVNALRNTLVKTFDEIGTLNSERRPVADWHARHQSAHNSLVFAYRKAKSLLGAPETTDEFNNYMEYATGDLKRAADIVYSTGWSAEPQSQVYPSMPDDVDADIVVTEPERVSRGRYAATIGMGVTEAATPHEEFMERYADGFDTAEPEPVLHPALELSVSAAKLPFRLAASVISALSSYWTVTNPTGSDESRPTEGGETAERTDPSRTGRLETPTEDTVEPQETAETVEAETVEAETVGASTASTASTASDAASFYSYPPSEHDEERTRTEHTVDPTEPASVATKSEPAVTRRPRGVAFSESGPAVIPPAVISGDGR